ncbi:MULTISPECIES: outer membrane beta-barrel protein [unclassified Saccharicrinis]|uniref:outer membrane beta-barrel protein n=1 Tax=unclassified Saccharicrinis TaxID=2646859 RepID=UPI003D342778
MNKNKNIDHIFKDGLAHFSEVPPAHVWNAVQGGAQGVGQNKKAIIFWRSVAAAVIIGLLFLGGLFWNNRIDNKAMVTDNAIPAKGTDTKKANEDTDNMILKDSSDEESHEEKYMDTESNYSPNPPIVAFKNNKQAVHPEGKTGTENVSTGFSERMVNNEQINSSTGVTDGMATSPHAVPISKIEPGANIQLANALPVDATQLFNTQNQNTIIDLETQAANNLLIAINNPLDNPEENKKRTLQFAIGGQFSPSYSYRETGSSGNANSTAANEDGIMSYTGGINLNIKTRKRWGIETGIFYAQVGQKFSNPLIGRSDKMLYSASPAAGIRSREANLKNSMGNIKLQSSAQQDLIQEVATSSANIQLNTRSDATFTANELEIIKIQQELDYIEIPFLLRYDLLNKSVGISISGGMSTNFLIGNGAYKIENNSKDKIGEMEHISEINYTAIFGLGLRTPILKSLDFNFEPRIRYFMNSVTEQGGSYKPYSIGVYTGVSYTF